MVKNKNFLYLLVLLFLLSTAISAYTILQPAKTNNQIYENKIQIESRYDYKAKVTPNILYPDGGTIDVGNTIFKKITTAIPFQLTSSITAERQVEVQGTHEVQLAIIAGDLWEKIFPMEEKQKFKQKGLDISLIDHTYSIDLETIQSFITKVEDETGIRSEQYTLEIRPNIEGTINYKGEERAIQVQDILTFQSSYDEIQLAGEKEFSTSSPFTSDRIMTNVFHIGGMEVPINPVRTGSIISSLLLLAAILFITKEHWHARKNQIDSHFDTINKKYRSRIIPVSQKINMTQKSIFVLDSFKSVLKIADEKELPIFYFIDLQNESDIYFLVDGDYLYSYEARKTEVISAAKKKTGSDRLYARH